MFYPPAPWHLYGHALQSSHLVDIAKAKEFVPADLEIVAVLPGKTLGGMYLSVYFAKLNLGRSWLTLQFDELHLTANAPNVVG